MVKTATAQSKQLIFHTQCSSAWHLLTAAHWKHRARVSQSSTGACSSLLFTLPTPPSTDEPVRNHAPATIYSKYSDFHIVVVKGHHTNADWIFKMRFPTCKKNRSREHEVDLSPPHPVCELQETRWPFD